MEKDIKQERKYFGAANGYSGFRSHFNSIFSPNKLDKLFIIKGGPGTGKSTLMRRVSEECRNSFDITTILCSSDPDSLDGILISKDGVTIGIADGTSPHTLEPKFPGAIEEIVNLGDGFDLHKLRAKRDAVLSYSECKKMSYNSAYASLNIAGEIYRYITTHFLKCQYYNAAEEKINEYITDEKSYADKRTNTDFLISSFSKYGYKCLPIFYENKRKISVIGDGISEYIYLSEIKKALSRKGICYRIFPSAFSDEIPDIIETGCTVYEISEDADDVVDSLEFIPKTCEYARLKNAYRCFLENAQFSLIRASEYHFKLEDIYSSAISFDSNEEKYFDILNKINYIFDK